MKRGNQLDGSLAFIFDGINFFFFFCLYSSIFSLLCNGKEILENKF